MMTMLFNSFDLKYYQWPHLILVFMLVFYLNSDFKLTYRGTFLSGVAHLVFKFMEELNPKFLPKYSAFVLISVCFGIFFMNFSSIYPFLFPMTATLGIPMPIILSLWSTTVVFMIKNYFGGFMSHMIPQGAPLYLVVFLFAIEMVSSLIRPITGSMRIIANVMAGHLLMILLSNVVLSFGPSLAVYAVLNLAEVIISAIQAYIFVTMIALYLCDLR